MGTAAAAVARGDGGRSRVCPVSVRVVCGSRPSVAHADHRVLVHRRPIRAFHLDLLSILFNPYSIQDTVFIGKTGGRIIHDTPVL